MQEVSILFLVTGLLTIDHKISYLTTTSPSSLLYNWCPVHVFFNILLYTEVQFSEVKKAIYLKLKMLGYLYICLKIEFTFQDTRYLYHFKHNKSYGFFEKYNLKIWSLWSWGFGWWNRKVWLLITIFATSFSFSLPY